MRIISHRGNINGINPKFENNPEYILHALSLGFEVEIDVRVIDNKIYLGHDTCDYKIEIDFLKNDKLWCHAKNYEALNLMISENIHCFSHSDDPYTLTSNHIIWVYPGGDFGEHCICVLPERYNRDITDELKKCYGICTDYPEYYKYLLN